MMLLHSLLRRQQPSLPLQSLQRLLRCRQSRLLDKRHPRNASRRPSRSQPKPGSLHLSANLQRSQSLSRRMICRRRTIRVISNAC